MATAAHLVLVTLALVILITESMAVQHGINLIWAQRSSKRIDYAKIVGIEGYPKDWISTGKLKVRQISAPSIQWHFNALAYQYDTKTIYWSEKGNKRIQGLRLDGSTETNNVFNGTSSDVEGLAVDWVSRNLYFTDSVYNWVMMVGLNSTVFPHKLVTDTNLDRPMGIAVYPQKGYLFWSDWGVEPKIEVSDLVGENRRVLVGRTLMYPRGLTVDHAENVLYWVDSGLDTVESVQFSGANRRQIASQPGSDFYGIALYKEYLFVTEQNEGHLRMYDKTKGTNYVNYNLDSTPYGIIMYEENLQEGDFDDCFAMGCEHICVNGPLVGPKCYCGDGFQLEKDNRTCKAQVEFATPSHVYTIGDAVCQYPANLPDMSLTNVTLDKQCFITDGNGFMALAFNVYENMLFISENGTQKIYRAHFKDGATKEVIVGGVGAVQGMAVDWVANNLYWTDSVLKHIMVSRLDGSYQKILLNTPPQQPLGIAVHPYRRQLFWTLVGSDPMIETSFLDGSSRQLVNIKKERLGMPNHLTIDFKFDRLYWSDSTLDNIRYLDLDTGSVIKVISVPDSHIFGISVFQDYIFWTDRDERNGVHVAIVDSGKKVRGIIHPVVGVATDIIAFSESSQPIRNGFCSSVDAPADCKECGNLNGGCEQLCLAGNGTNFHCACGLGFKLDVGGSTCTSQVLEDNYLVVTDAYQKQIYQVGAVSNRFNAIHVSIHYRPIAVDLDPVDKKVYWSDITSKVIKRVNLDGTYEEVVAVLSMKSIPDGIAVDYLNRLVYYTDTGRDEIGVISMTNSSKSKVVVRSTTEEPRDIAVDPYEGSIFWTDWGSKPMIERAATDGSRRLTIVNLTVGSWPNGLTIDYKGKLLYWCDAKNNKIMSADFDGNNVQTLYEEETAHYFGIALMGSYIYLTDWSRKSIMRLDRQNPKFLEVVGPATFGRLNGIQAYNASEIIKGTSVCKDEDCEFLCLPMPNGGKVCACPDDYILNSDGRTCSVPTTSIVPSVPSTVSSLSLSTSLSTGQSPSSPTTQAGPKTTTTPTPVTSAAQTSNNTTTVKLPASTQNITLTSTFSTVTLNSSSTLTPGKTLFPTTTSGSSEKVTNNDDDTGIHPGIIVLIVILCLGILAAVAFMGVYLYRRWRSGGRQILVEDERVDSYYQIAFPERANEEASLDSGIENPTYKYTMSELQAAEAEQLASLR
ncbi:low-density lipoprotein receptor-related protein 6-like isoform X2 [Liolophura sinensis]|uniref:low-density lipoprotein receptor-related protein 6-like isoform X2 n=1 Tax=Liolophura sinensis TaxID=3198878 RepID=UPI003158BB52